MVVLATSHDHLCVRVIGLFDLNLWKILSWLIAKKDESLTWAAMQTCWSALQSVRNIIYRCLYNGKQTVFSRLILCWLNLHGLMRIVTLLDLFYFGLASVPFQLKKETYCLDPTQLQVCRTDWKSTIPLQRNESSFCLLDDSMSRVVSELSLSSTRIKGRIATGALKSFKELYFPCRLKKQL